MSAEDDVSRLPAEARARMLIDGQLDAAGWSVGHVGRSGVAVTTG